MRRGVGAAVRATDERSVKRDDVEEGTETEFAQREPASEAEFGGVWVEEEFDGVVSGLSVDIDGAGEIGCEGVVEPVVICEPRTGASDEEQVASTGVIQAAGVEVAWGENVLDAGDGSANCGGVLDACVVADVDVSDLMISNGEGTGGVWGAVAAKGCAGIEEFEALFGADSQEACTAEFAVDVDWGIDWFDPVFAEDDGLDAAALVEVEQTCDLIVDGTDFGGDLRIVGAEFLERVIKVREVDEREGRGVVFFDEKSGVGDPAGA